MFSKVDLNGFNSKTSLKIWADFKSSLEWLTYVKFAFRQAHLPHDISALFQVESDSSTDLQNDLLELSENLSS